MKKLARRLLIGCGSALLLLLPALAAPVLAFDKVWDPLGCTNVPADEVGLWDDAPGAGLNNESGFFWFVTDQAANEQCGYYSKITGESSATLKMSVRAAVNDGAVLKVELRQREPGEDLLPCDGELIGSVTIYGDPTTQLLGPRSRHASSDSSQSEFVTEWVQLPDGKQLGEVCMSLNDLPNGVASERASALVDYIKIGQSLDPPAVCTTRVCKADTDITGVWQETFQRAH